MSLVLPYYVVNAKEIPKPKLRTKVAQGTITNTSQKVFPKGIAASSFKRSWDEGYDGRGIVVAIIDTGVDSNHPDLRGKVTKSFNLTTEKTLVNSHGTHVAGTIAANGWVTGGAPNCSIIDIKVISAAGGSIPNLVIAINTAANGGASVINMSLGGSGLSQGDINNIKNAVQNAWNKGAICIAAAGNDGKSVCTLDPYSYPASVKISESVAACEVSDTLNTISLCYFSNENNEVDLAACGQNVLSSVLGGGYAVYSGTSMATPHVAAMAAVLAQKIKKETKLTGAGFSAALVEALHKQVMYVPSCTINNNGLNGNGLNTMAISCHRPVAINTNIRSEKKDIVTPMLGTITPQYANTSFGLGFLRYQPSKGPVIPPGKKYYYNGIFLGYIY